MKIMASLVAFILASTAANAAEPRLGWPVDCTEGKNCWIVNHVDQDTSAAARDFHCGHLTYEGHDGTDIAARDFAAIQSGMDVRAALDGKVVRVRNDVEDHHGTTADLAAAKQSKKECGNLVSLLHDDKWVTEYCHMKKGSIAVALGDTVTKGTKLGQVGQSGLAQFPHLHFSLRHNNSVVDPFTAQGVAGCGDAGHALWEKDIPYQPVKIYAAGFSSGAPDIDSVTLHAGPGTQLKTDSDALVFWASLFGLEPGDRIDITLLYPDGKVFAKSSQTASQRKIRYLVYAGKNNRTHLAPGTYSGTALLSRTLPDGSVLTRKIEEAVTIR